MIVPAGVQEVWHRPCHAAIPLRARVVTCHHRIQTNRIDVGNAPAQQPCSESRIGSSGPWGDVIFGRKQGRVDPRSGVPSQELTRVQRHEAFEDPTARAIQDHHAGAAITGIPRREGQHRLLGRLVQGDQREQRTD